MKYETIKLTFSSAASAVLALLGQNYKLVILLITLIIVDTISGNLWALTEGSWRSTIARKGLYSKLFELVLVALMYMCEWVFAINWLVNAVVLYFAVCEGASVLENISRFNSNVPQESLDFLSNMKQNFLTKFKEWIRDFFGGGGNADN